MINFLITPIKSSIKNVVSRLSHSEYHNTHKKKALKAIQTIENHNKLKLSPKLIKDSDAYAIDVLGGKEYAPWLYVYSTINQRFKEGWIPDNYFGTIVSSSLGMSQITQVKTFSNRILQTELLPDLAYYIDGNLYDKNYLPISFSDFQDTLGAQYKKVFLKSDRTDKGKGIKKLDLGSIDQEALKRSGNCVIQSPIEQHPFFEEVMPDSVANIRITTVRNLEGDIEFRASHINLGRKNNEWIQANNFIQVAILNRDGELDSFGYEQDWRRWESHPDTGFTFSNKRVPLFNLAVDTCMSLHRSVPHFLIIGWDVAIGRDNKIKLIEWNAGHIGIKLDEAVTGPCFTGLNWEQLRNR